METPAERVARGREEAAVKHTVPGSLSFISNV